MKSTKNLAGILTSETLACGVLAAATPVSAREYGLVILYGRLMDPKSRYDALANVGVKDGNIAVITKKKITGKKH